MSSQGNPGPEQYRTVYVPGPAPKASSAATVSVVLGVISLCFWPLGLVALLCGIQGRSDVTRRGMTGNGQSVAGIIMGAITTLLTAIGLIVFLLGLLP